MTQHTRKSIDDTIAKFAKLDYFTQKTIMLEFPEFFGSEKTRLDCAPIEHFPERKFNLNEFFGGFLLVVNVIAIIGLLWDYLSPLIK